MINYFCSFPFSLCIHCQPEIDNFDISSVDDDVFLKYVVLRLQYGFDIPMRYLHPVNVFQTTERSNNDVVEKRLQSNTEHTSQYDHFIVRTDAFCSSCCLNKHLKAGASTVFHLNVQFVVLAVLKKICLFFYLLFTYPNNPVRMILRNMLVRLPNLLHNRGLSKSRRVTSFHCHHFHSVALFALFFVAPET